MEKFNDLLNEYGLAYVHERVGEERLGYLIERVAYLKDRDGYLFDMEKNFKSAVGSLFTRGYLMINDQKKFVEVLGLTRQSKKNYPLWFYEIFDLGIGSDLDGKKTFFYNAYNVNKCTEVIRREIKKKKEDEFLDEVTKSNRLERVFHEEKSTKTGVDALQLETIGFEQMLLILKEAQQMKKHIIKVLREEYEEAVNSNSKPVYAKLEKKN